MVKYSILFIVNFTKSNEPHDNRSSFRNVNAASNKNQYPRGMFVFNVKDNVKQCLHIRYKSFAQQINNVYIVCAGKIAKIFTEHGSTVMKTVDLYENQYWLVFAIKHDNQVHSFESAMEYYKSYASFTFTFNKYHFPLKARTEKLDMTYVGKIPPRDLSTNSGRVIPRVRQLAELKETAPETKPNKNRLQTLESLSLDRQQACEAYSTIVELMEQNEFSATENVSNQNVDMADKMKNSTAVIKLDGKSLFYDEQFFKTILKNPSSNCNSIAVIIDAGNFYNTEMKSYFLPLVLRIPRLYFLPTQDFQDLNIEHLYLQTENEANVLFTTEIQIGPIPVDQSEVRINYKDVFFIESQKIQAAAEFVLSESVVFKLISGGSNAKTPAATLYGGRPADAIVGNRTRFSTQRKTARLLDTYHGRQPRQLADKRRATLVGCAAFDLSALVHRSHRVNAIKPFTTTRCRTNANHQAKQFDECVFKEHKLRDSGMCIELSVNLGSQLNVGLNRDRGLFHRHYTNRVVIVCQHSYTRELLKFYEELIKHNAKIISPKHKKSEKSPKTEKNGLFSGYVIDCVEYTIMFVEGVHNILRTILNEHFTDHEPSTLLYDRKTIFTKVLYETFFEFGGFYHVSMCQPLDSFLSNFAFYLKGSVPSAAWKAILKLDLTRKCKSMKEFCENCLAIEPDELQDLDKEFGLPMQKLVK